MFENYQWAGPHDWGSSGPEPGFRHYEPDEPRTVGPTLSDDPEVLRAACEAWQKHLDEMQEIIEKCDKRSHTVSQAFIDKWRTFAANRSHRANEVLPILQSRLRELEGR